MTNPTTPFSWQMPQSTDLVTDLPADFETFGQAVATSMADLLGGTTGQILSKASNTDMDFTWVANDVGDITAVTAGTGITGGGTSGAVTVSFDQANYGGGQFAAAKNKIINGDFRINQRAFTSNTTNGSFNFDRFRQVNGGGTVTCTPQVFTPGTAPVTGYEGTNFLRMVTSGQSAAGDLAIFQQSIESVRTLAGQTATVSFWAKAGSGTPKIAIEMTQNFGTGGSPSAEVTYYGGQVTLSTSWARYSVSINLTSLTGKTIGTSNDLLNVYLWTSAGSTYNARTGSLGVQNNTFDTWGWQVEAGSTATPFQTATGTIQGELAACQRYFYRHVSGNNKAIMTAAAYSSTVIAGTVFFKTEMRTAPTLTVPNVATYFAFNANSTFTYASTLSLQEASPNAGTVFGTFGATTAGFAGYVITSNASSFIDFGAEL